MKITTMKFVTINSFALYDFHTPQTMGTLILHMTSPIKIEIILHRIKVKNRSNIVMICSNPSM